MHTTEATHPTDALPPQPAKRVVYAVRTGVRAGAGIVRRLPQPHPSPGG